MINPTKHHVEGTVISARGYVYIYIYIVLPDSQLYFRWIHLSHDAFLIPRLVFRNTAHDVFLRGETAFAKTSRLQVPIASRLLQESTPTNLAYLQKSQHNGT